MLSVAPKKASTNMTIPNNAKWVFLALAIELLVVAPRSYAFDLEDYATTMRATRDIYLREFADYESQLRMYMDVRSAVVFFGGMPRDEAFLASIGDDKISGSCEGTQFSDVAPALGNYYRYIFPYTSQKTPDPYLDVLEDEFGVTYRSELEQQILARFGQPSDSDAPQTNITVDWPSGSNVTCGDLCDILNREAHALAHASKDLSSSIPPAKAAARAYEIASSVYLSSKEVGVRIFAEGLSAEYHVEVAQSRAELPYGPVGLNAADAERAQPSETIRAVLTGIQPP